MKKWRLILNYKTEQHFNAAAKAGCIKVLYQFKQVKERMVLICDQYQWNVWKTQDKKY